ncbi:MAG: hypothetical protein ABR529_06335 [Actinomycetota bacterium]
MRAVTARATGLRGGFLAVALPQLLAGPILRRTEAKRISIWVATTASVRPSAEILRFVDGPYSAPVPIAAAGARSAALGKNLSVHLITITPEEGAFPTDELLAYDVELRDGEGASDGHRLESLGLLRGSTPLSYGSFPLPTFYVRERAPALRVMHGSCRLLHGGGEDSFLAADEVIARSAHDIAQRPSAIFLTGDQIYADDVGGPIIGHLRRLATTLVGAEDETSVPGIGSLADVGVDDRGNLVLDQARFTSARPQNHLMSFGEFAAMYITAWNEAVWPSSFASATEVLSTTRSRFADARAARRYERQRRYLEAARGALPAVRRVIANTPTYTNFDDHDTTDDWNLTQAWRDGVWKSPTGRRIVANALAAYWAFQGWGNDPDAYDDSFIATITGFLTGDPSDRGDSFDHALWSFDRWSYFAPTNPPAIVIDTRTQRDYDSPDGGARLLGRRARGHVIELMSKSRYRREDPLIVVSAVPVFGFELQERRQKYLVDRLGPYEIDFEAWHSNLRGLVDFMQMLVEDIDPSSCIMLSGDVHYGVNARASFVIEDKTLLFTQLVSSGQKHAGTAAKTALNTLGRLLKTKHTRLGWDRPPDCKRQNNVADRIMLRAVNTDEWADDSPVFLAPRDVKLLGIKQPPDFRECRIYVRPQGRNPSILVGENNMGFVSLEDDQVTHRLLARAKDRTREHVAKIKLNLEGLD